MIDPGYWLVYLLGPMGAAHNRFVNINEPVTADGMLELINNLPDDFVIANMVRVGEAKDANL